MQDVLFVRVDNAAGGAKFGDLDALTRLKGYVAALRRRWYLIVVPVVLGVAMGWVSTPDAPASIVNSTRYYRASHVLIVDGQAAQSGQSVNLSQAAYLVSTGEIPQKVATKVGVPVDLVRSSVIALPRAGVEAVEVQAVGTNKAQSMVLADAAAGELLSSLKADAKSAADTGRDQVIGELDRLDGEISALNGRIAANPPNRDQLEAQQRSLSNQYSLAYEQFSQLANLPAPTAGLVSLEAAKAVVISESEFNAISKTIRDGADYVTGTTTMAEPDPGGSGVPGPGVGSTTRAGLGGLTGLGLGLALVLLLDRFDSRLRRREEVEAATGLTVLAEIPPLSRHEQHDLEVVAHTQHRSRAAEAYRVVRGAVLFALGPNGAERTDDEGAIVLMVTSANPAEGKTTTVANLAAVLAEGGFNVLVINCDFRRPRVHKYLLGQSDLNVDGPSEAPRIGSVVVTNTNLERVRLITGLGEGDPNANPLDVVALQRKVIQATRSRFDVILLDTAPFLTTNDASELLSETDQVLVVVRAGKTKVDAARRTSEILERFEAPVLGVVLNDSSEANSAQYYYYGYNAEKPGKRRRGGSSDAPNGDRTGEPTAPTATTDPDPADGVTDDATSGRAHLSQAAPSTPR